MEKRTESFIVVLYIGRGQNNISSKRPQDIGYLAFRIFFSERYGYALHGKRTYFHQNPKGFSRLPFVEFGGRYLASVSIHSLINQCLEYKSQFQAGVLDHVLLIRI